MDRNRSVKILFVLLLVAALALGVHALISRWDDAVSIWEDAMWMMSDRSIKQFSLTDQAIKNPDRKSVV